MIKFQAGPQPAAVNDTTDPTGQPDSHCKTAFFILESLQDLMLLEDTKKGYRVD